MARQKLSGIQIPTLSKLNIDGEFTLDAAAGTSGQVLTSAGAGNTPTWTTVSGGALGYIGNYQTTSASVTTGTVTIGGAAGANIDPFKLSLLGGSTTSAGTNGGGITITGGNSTNTSTITTGGSISIKGGNGNASQGGGGGVTIDGGTGSGPSVNGNGYVSIGTATGTDTVNIGRVAGNVQLSAGTTNITGNLSFDGSSSAFTSVNQPGVLRVDTGSLQMNFNNLSTFNGQGGFQYGTETFLGFQTSTGAGRIPVIHSVFSKATVTTGQSAPGTFTTNIFAAANDVLSSLQAGKLYRFKAKFYLSTTFTSGANTTTIPLTFSNAPVSIKYSFRTYPETAGSTITRMGAGTTTTITPVAASLSAAGTWVVEVDGHFDSHATLASTLTPVLSNNIVTSSGGTASITTGSWIEIEKLGTSTQTLIAGNWA